LRKYLVDNKMATEAEMDAIETKAQELVNEAAEFALNSPEPDPANVMDDVFYVPTTEVAK
jgi:pyruvate dehydrogenase E1 component alpha subunit